MISFAAAATTGGVKRFSIPNWSVGPNLPQALPGGPLGSSGSDEKGGWEVLETKLGVLSEDMVLGFGKWSKWFYKRLRRKSLFSV